jgi:hypothetical protein
MKLRLTIAAVALLAASPTFAQTFNSGSATFKGCQNAAGEGPENEALVRQGFCMGVVNSVLYYENFRAFCLNDSIAIQQAVKVVSRYMQNTPEELHLPLYKLATSAFAKAWPCK